MYRTQNSKYKVGRCYWRKNSRLIYLYPGKYDWEGSPAHGDCSLRIKVRKIGIIHSHIFASLPNLKDDLPFQATSAQFDSGMWQCTVSATTYQGRIFFRDTLDSDPVSLVVLRTPSHAEIRRRDDVSGTIAGLAGKDLEVLGCCNIVLD